MRPTLPSQSLQSGLWGQAWGVLQKQPCILSSAIHVPKKQLPNRGLEGRVRREESRHHGKTGRHHVDSNKLQLELGSGRELIPASQTG